MKTDRKYIPIRVKFPKVYRYQKDGNDYFLVDARSKTWGLKIRKNFNFKEEALKYAQEIESQILEKGKKVSDKQIYQDKDIERLDAMLKPFGKTLPEAVEFYVRFMQEEMKKSVVPLIRDLCLKWYESKRDSKNNPLSDATKNELKILWRFIARTLGMFRPSEVTHEMIEKLIEEVGGSETNVTRKHYLTYVRMFFTWCVKHKYIQANPTDNVQVKIRLKDVEIYTPEETGKLLTLCQQKFPQLLGFYCLSAFGGLRPSEAERAEWSDINFETKEIYVKPLGKTGSRRFVLKETDTLWVWLKYIKEKFPNQPLNPIKNHQNYQKKLRLGFGKWIKDGLRHSFGTYYHNLTRNIPEVVFVMGNSVGIAKRHYVREVTKERRDSYWALKPVTENQSEPRNGFVRTLSEGNSLISQSTIINP